MKYFWIALWWIGMGLGSARAADLPSDTSLNDSVIREGVYGDRLILKFSPSIPELSATHYPDKKMSVVQWEAKSKKSFTRRYLFKDPKTTVEKVLLKIDADKGKGALVIWHLGEGDFSLNKKDNKELVFSLVIPGRPNEELGEAVSMEEIRRITLSVKGASLGKVLRTIAAESHRNIVFDDAIEGSVSVNFRDLEYEEAIDQLLRATKYQAEHQDNVTVIRQRSNAESLRVFYLKHVDVNLVLKSLEKIAAEAKVGIDSNSNTIFVRANKFTLDSVERALTTLDRPQQQVEVEAAIVEIENQDNLDVGFDLSANISHGSVANSISSSVSPLDQNLPSVKGLFVGLTWQSVTGILGGIASTGKINVLGRPRILALNDQQAEIILGSRIGYKTLTVTQTGTVEDVQFLTVGTQLKIRPHITASSDILMEIEPEVSDGQLDPNTLLPSQNTTKQTTKVVSKSGQTIVIGGLLRDRTEETVSKVPILGDIPLLGFFFRGSRERSVKKEVMILLAPKIVDPATLESHQVEGQRMLQKFYGERLQSQTPLARMP